MENADKIVGALRCCGNTDTKKPDCEHCPLQSTRMCVKVMLEGAADLIEQKQPCISELEQQLAKKDAIIKRQQDDHAFWMTEEMIVQKQLKAQLAESQQREQAAVDGRDELQKALALACRIMSDNFPACLPDNQSWQDHILDRVRTEPVCRVCGCTEDNACPGGCYWVEPDLCSACAQAREAGKGEAE